jgi:hypothetical protein
MDPQPNLGMKGNLPEPYWAVDSFMTTLDDNDNRSSHQGLWISYGFFGTNHTIHCGVYNATYNTQVQYTQGVPAINTSVVRHDRIDDSVTQNYKSINSTDTPFQAMKTWALVNLYSIHNAAARHLIGSIAFGGREQFNYDATLIGLSRFVQVEAYSFTFPTNLCNLLENYLINTTLSLTHFLQEPSLSQIYKSTAASPATYASASATVFSFPPRYSYSFPVLWTPYSIALLLAAMIIALGCVKLWNNGVDADLSFSQVLATTRNQSLDQLCAGSNLGGENISKELLRTKIKFGHLQGSQGHACFGLETEIDSLNGRSVHQC